MATIKRVSDKGWLKIVEWIKATKNDDQEYRFDAKAAEAWCSEAEESMAAGNPPMVEMPGNATASGNPETFTVPADCIYEIDPDETAIDILETIRDKTGSGATVQGFDLFPQSFVAHNEDLHQLYDFSAAVRYLMQQCPDAAETLERETGVEQP